MSHALLAYLPDSTQYEQLNLEYDAQERTVWCEMRPIPRPCFSPTLLRELKDLPRALRAHGVAQDGDAWKSVHAVFTSAAPDVFNLGGDLHLFVRAIRNQDRAGLTSYAKACIDALYPVSTGFGLPITTVSVVQGAALGGGMEGALATDYIVAEKGVHMGLPEVLFNLFPGMGAYSFLSRRLSPAEAERIIMSGRNWTAEELYERGVVDVLAEPGEGIVAAREFIRQRQRHSVTASAMRQVQRKSQSVAYDELMDITMIWVDAALQLGDRELRIMERLVRAQDRLIQKHVEQTLDCVR